MQEQRKASSTPTIGLTLGGGGARGLSHILAIEVFEELGIRPHVIAGCSIGAILGAAFASGMPAKEIAERATSILGKRTEIIRRMFASAGDSLSELWNLRPLSAAAMNPISLMEVIFDGALPSDFSKLQIPLSVVATDYNTQSPYVLKDGPLMPAVAASMALPAVFRTVEHQGKILMDGGLADPLPFDIIASDAEISVAVDVTGIRVRDIPEEPPSALEAILAASQIMQNAIVREKLERLQPDILVRPIVSRFKVLEFYKIHEILDSARPMKDELKLALDAALSAEPQKTL